MTADQIRRTPMRIRHGVLVLGATLGACAGGSVERESVPVEKVFVEEERSPERTAGFCAKCRMQVFQGHRCGLTVPCVLCRREQGARHVHEIVWVCRHCGWATRRQHVCNDARICEMCRKDKQSLLGTIACEQCFRQAEPSEIRGLTSYCGVCNREVGADHVHEKTSYCLACLREAGAGHRCGATRYCPSCGVEQAPDHIHGTTRYCGVCSREAGLNHRCGLTEWCWRCGAEVEWPHQFH